MKVFTVPEETVGQRIKRLRREWEARHRQELRQQDLAEKVGVSRTTIANWENDVRTPHSKNLRPLAQALETTPEYILYGENGGRPGTLRERGPRYGAEPEEGEPVGAPDYDSLGIELPGYDRLLETPRRTFDWFMVDLFGRGLSREDLEEFGRGVLAPIANMNMLHREGEEHDADTAEEQMNVLRRMIDFVHDRLARRGR